MIKTKPREMICSDCKFVDSRGELDKCPYCHGDDWKKYTKKPYMFMVSDLRSLIKDLRDDDWVDLEAKESK